MDYLTLYYKIRDQREAIAQDITQRILNIIHTGMFNSIDMVVNDTSTKRAKIIGEIVVGMMYSSGYWATFRTYNYHDFHKLIFTLTMMTHEERVEAGLENLTPPGNQNNV